ncbi:cobalt-precorrin-5B (C(1))-methyltransferase [Geobacillus subterraneus]|uniref:Cobalt-precorrin-5B C(1)-methyltransferase n=2 Tax=Geobacillus TaxID=129337 RepID=A0ABN4NG12_9BACL|nr:MULTISPECIES: cobalt-precorrin-5B (C(1))-methyltransferase [Geobacillus]AMX83534.1 cobalt-precorrin-5B (C(1))-methyltransferase [Geobacillus subterraneus]KZS25040.1 cobalt-precorrin-5B (C(1))-methyltransferase [Geobacillus subterraneus]OXB87766.1 cobalt-precorrin-5B (C(1))-methyltransferase [Geobacillus uzenensis]QIZ67841.1 cobalt-precorrin-5B (C(1))-methyltransferase [Geobacillus subterraneus]WPZ16841.1 cobalt-precorrin-5B (C(1))-methyltransferase [Geobacillus subterraneus]
MEAKKTLREGYTTGSCATAATKAALTALITGRVQTEATIRLPIGRAVTFSVQSCTYDGSTATAAVVKDGGDDPDATHGALIVSTVSWASSSGVHLDGGEGVGRVTKPGLPVPVGEAAINPVPRKMIRETAKEVLEQYGIDRGVNIVISVPGGEEIAKKTLNARLGIIGGISILGTRGIVVPFSTAAYRASIVQAIQVAKASGCRHVVITTGGRSEKYAMREYPGLPEEAFIEMGDFVGFTLKQCKRLGIETVSMVGMMGKFSKVAQGVMMVHAKSAPVDFGFLARLAEQAGAPAPLVAAVREANTAAQVGDMMQEAGCTTFFQLLCEACCRAALNEVGGGMTVETSIYTMNGQRLGKAVQTNGND